MKDKDKKTEIQKRQLEDYKPGATRSEVLSFMEKAATSPKSCQKRSVPPAPSSK